MTDQLRVHRDDAAAIVRRQRMLGELAAIYEATVKAWGKRPTRAYNRDQVTLTKNEMAVLNVQIEALRSLFDGYGVDPTKLPQVVCHGPEIRQMSGPMNAAEEVLTRLRGASESTLSK